MPQKHLEFICIYLNVAEVYREDLDSKKKLEDLIHLAELCIEVLQQNEEHHAEVLSMITML